MNDKLIHSAVAKYSSGCCTVTEFFSSVSHCCDNVTHPLNQNADTGSSTEEYEYELDDVDDNTVTRSPVSANSNTTASATVVPASAPASCDVCLDAPRVKVALLSCGHATFCQQY